MSTDATTQALAAPPLWMVGELAAHLRTTSSAVYRRRSLGRPLPPAIRVGRSLRWDPDTVAAWLAAQTEGVA